MEPHDVDDPGAGAAGAAAWAAYDAAARERLVPEPPKRVDAPERTP